MRRHRTSAVAATALLVAALAACGSSSHASSSPITVFNVAADPSRNLPATDPKHHVTLTTATLRLTVDALLSKHVVLVAALVHRVVAGAAGAEGPAAALTANTAALTAAIDQVYGADAARAFEQLWTQHTQFFLDYAQAAHDHNGGAKDKAETELLDYQKDFANFVSTATAEGVALAEVTALLHGHVHDVTSYIDAVAAGHETEARQILAVGVAHMHVIAQAVSRAIAAQHLKTVKP
jgi:hypothetical protein